MQSRIFALNTEEYPHSANTFDSLGEAYVISGDKSSAYEELQNIPAVGPG